MGRQARRLCDCEGRSPLRIPLPADFVHLQLTESLEGPVTFG